MLNIFKMIHKYTDDLKYEDTITNSNGNINGAAEDIFNIICCTNNMYKAGLTPQELTNILQNVLVSSKSLNNWEIDKEFIQGILSDNLK
jgi:hypothetical protein